MTSSNDKDLPFVKIVYEFPVTETSSNLIRFDSWEYKLSSEDVNSRKDLRVSVEKEWISVEKYACYYVCGNAETGNTLPSVGEWKTVFLIPRHRVIYIATEDVAFRDKT